MKNKRIMKWKPYKSTLMQKESKNENSAKNYTLKYLFLMRY